MAHIAVRLVRLADLELGAERECTGLEAAQHSLSQRQELGESPGPHHVGRRCTGGWRPEHGTLRGQYAVHTIGRAEAGPQHADGHLREREGIGRGDAGSDRREELASRQ